MTVLVITVALALGAGFWVRHEIRAYQRAHQPPAVQPARVRGR